MCWLFGEPVMALFPIPAVFPCSAASVKTWLACIMEVKPLKLLKSVCSQDKFFLVCSIFLFTLLSSLSSVLADLGTDQDSTCHTFRNGRPGCPVTSSLWNWGPPLSQTRPTWQTPFWDYTCFPFFPSKVMSFKFLVNLYYKPLIWYHKT